MSNARVLFFCDVALKNLMGTERLPKFFDGLLDSLSLIRKHELRAFATVGLSDGIRQAPFVRDSETRAVLPSRRFGIGATF